MGSSIDDGAVSGPPLFTMKGFGSTSPMPRLVVVMVPSGSSTDFGLASLNEPRLKLLLAPSLAVWLLAAVTTGATLVTRMLVV